MEFINSAISLYNRLCHFLLAQKVTKKGTFFECFRPQKPTRPRQRKRLTLFIGSCFAIRLDN